MSSPWIAWPPGIDPAQLSRSVAAGHDTFVSTGAVGRTIRPVVVESWRRSLSSGVNPDCALPPVDLCDDALHDYRAAHPLAGVMPVIRRLLVEDATDSGLIVAVTDADGRLLWVEGEPGLRGRAESMHFMEGASWGEEHAGTNAPGTAIALDHSVQIFASEHFARNVSPWSCSAAPIHDPDTGALLGALDLTGGDAVAAPQTLALVRATVAAVESELRLQRLRSLSAAKPATTNVSTGRPFDTPTELRVLGLDRGMLVGSTLDGPSLSGPTRDSPMLDCRPLSLRHSELLLLLTEHPEGLSGGQLSVALHEHDGARVTVRAELSRLRGWLAEMSGSRPDHWLRSRPYRLLQPVSTDIAEVRSALRRGAYRQALSAYRGPVLPASEAPAVVALREELAASIRAALLAHRDPHLLLTHAESTAGQYDVELWKACLQTLPANSPRRARVSGHLAWLNRELH
ncbi:MAG TPA: GAF domain-containing protein [Mycobacteriales bacterium]|nr:GAF domain-containing protein [Mycobacteriales bacterium]